jgi:erythronate-4-phosphate dehydrogenase
MALKFIVDDNIPFIQGRLESVGDVIYTDQFGFTPELVHDADAIVIRTRTRANAALLEGSKVKLVATATIGTDQIDISWCESHGIEVRNAPGCNAPGVAQYVWSALLRKGFDPTRHTLGVVGCGNVGSIVSDWGRRLGARVIVNDPPKERAGFNNDYMPLEELLATSDAVTLHTPLTRDGEDATYHLIGEKELLMLKPGAIFINAARGPVTDGKALYEVLKKGEIRTVIDTWEGEPAIDPALLALTDYGTFHIAGYSKEGKQRATRMALEAIEQHFGVELDKSGLAPAYTSPADVAAEAILRSYDPQKDTDMLRNAPDAFDKLRHDYDFRKEPIF